MASAPRSLARVAALPGVGGVRWEPRSAAALASRLLDKPPALHCQDDVNGVLKARSLRFAEASAAIDPASEVVLDEVAAALRRCLGSVIAITGHTDAAGRRTRQPDPVAAARRGRAGRIGGARHSGIGAARARLGLGPSARGVWSPATRPTAGSNSRW